MKGSYIKKLSSYIIKSIIFKTITDSYYINYKKVNYCICSTIFVYISNRFGDSFLVFTYLFLDLKKIILYL